MDRHHDVETEEDLRTYANVFARLTGGSAPPEPPRLKNILTALRRRAVELGGRLRARGIALSDELRTRSVGLGDRLRARRVELGSRFRMRSGELAGRLRTRGTAFADRLQARGVELSGRLRTHGAQLAGRVRDERAAFARRLRAQAAALPRWHFTWHRPNPQNPPALRREPSLFVGLVSFAFAFAVAWWTGGPTDVVRARDREIVTEQAVPTVSATLPTQSAQPAAWDVGQVLRTPGASEAAQLAVVDELSKDPSDDATRALLAGINSDSLYVSMACLRALAGRPCDTVAVPLARRLNDPLWQRRAWAARILGSNECAGAGRRLTKRLRDERDARVQSQLQIAIQSLKERGA